MVTKLKEVDAVVIGMGWTGSILSRELTKAGLNVVGLERGAMRTPREDFAIPISVTSSNISTGTSCSRIRRPRPSACATRPTRPLCRCVGWARSCPATMWAAPVRIGTAQHGAGSKPITCCVRITPKNMARKSFPQT